MYEYWFGEPLENPSDTPLNAPFILCQLTSVSDSYLFCCLSDPITWRIHIGRGYIRLVEAWSIKLGSRIAAVRLWNAGANPFAPTCAARFCG